jgi:hypothetical protein
MQVQILPCFDNLKNMKDYNCKECARQGTTTIINGRGNMRAHYASVHPSFISRAKEKKIASEQTSFMKLQEHAKQFRSLIEQLEQERDEIQRKLLAYDDMIAKYKKIN